MDRPVVDELNIRTAVAALRGILSPVLLDRFQRLVGGERSRSVGLGESSPPHRACGVPPRQSRQHEYTWIASE